YTTPFRSGPVPPDSRQRIGVEDAVVRVEQPECVLWTIELVPVVPTVQVLVERGLPYARLPVLTLRPIQLETQWRRAVRVGLNVEVNIARTRGEQAERRIPTLDLNPKREVRLERPEKSSRPQRHGLRGSGFRPGRLPGLRQIQRLLDLEREQVLAGAFRFDDPIGVSRLVALRIGRVCRHLEPVPFRGHELEAHGRMSEEAFRIPRPQQDRFAIQRSRTQFPLIPADCIAPAVEVA